MREFSQYEWVTESAVFCKSKILLRHTMHEVQVIKDGKTHIQVFNKCFLLYIDYWYIVDFIEYFVLV